MKFGVNTFIWTAGIDRDLLSRLPSIRQHGFNGVELPLIQPGQAPVADIRKQPRAEPTGVHFLFRCSNKT